jgi:hypothetical protein
MNKHFIASNEFLSFLLCTVPDMSELPRLLKFMHGLCKFSNNLKRKTANLEHDHRNKPTVNKFQPFSCDNRITNTLNLT